MTAREALQQALVGALRGAEAVGGVVTMIHDCPPVRAARPYVLVDEPVLVDWGTKDLAGREGRVSILAYDLGERPARLRRLAGAIDDAVADMPRELGGGWRTASLVLVRSRLLREGQGSWSAASEFRVRMLREG